MRVAHMCICKLFNFLINFKIGLTAQDRTVDATLFCTWQILVAEVLNQ